MFKEIDQKFNSGGSPHIFFPETAFNIVITETLLSFLGMNKCIITYFCQIQ